MQIGHFNSWSPDNWDGSYLAGMAGIDVHPDEGVCVQLCGLDRPGCAAPVPYCNPILADGLGICSVGRSAVRSRWRS